jgi:hypothetical protein
VVGPVASVIDEQLPGGLHALQVLIAVVLALCLLRAWYTSWRISRSSDLV